MAIEFDNATFDLPRTAGSLIKVIGVGGGGGKAVNYMYKQDIRGVDYIICNTDRQALDKSPIVNKIHLGVELTEGLGAGSNPEVGEQSAIESIEEIKAMLGNNTKMAFITAGMGGGTGTGAAPVIAKICRDMGILTVGIVTSPFKFEGEIRLAQAQKGIENLREQLDSLIVINNNKLRDTYGNLGIKTGFAKADEVLTIAAKGSAEVITKEFEVNIDLRDAHTVLSNSGTAIMGTGYGTGDNRALNAVKAALESPLLNDNRITGAKNVLLLILYGKEEITMDEVGEINEYIQKEAGNTQEMGVGYKTNIIMGMGEEAALEDKVMVTVVATGFSTEQQHEIIDAAPKKIVHSLDEDTSMVKELDTTSSFTDISFENSVKKKEKVVYHLEDTPQAAAPTPSVEEPATKSSMGITLHTEEKKIKTLRVEESLYRVPVHFEVVQRIVPLQQEEFVIYQEKKTVPQKPTPAPAKVQMTMAKEPEVATATLQEGGKIVHTLDDYMEVEEMLTQARSPYEEDDFKAEIRIKEPVKAKEQVKEAPTEPNQNVYMAALRENASHRKATFKHMSHQFSNQNNYRLEDLENTPAYMRKNVDISSTTATPSVSRSSISLDSNNIVQIRENNSYLHDNVD